MNEQELKYLLHLLDGLNDEIFDEILQLYFVIEESKSCKDISEESLEFFKRNLKANPVTASSILRYIQNNATDNKSNLYKIQTLYLDALKSVLSSSNNLDKLITLISLVQWDKDFVKEFSQNILKHVSDGVYRQYRKQILMSLMPHNQPELLKLMSDMMIQSSDNEFKLTPEYMLDLCYQEKTHWLVKAAEVYKNQLHDMKNVTFKINNFTKQILVMVLIELTNSDETYDLQPLVHQLTNIFSILDNYTSTDDQLQYYITEVKRELTVVKFCMENNSKLLTTGVFGQVLAQSALAVISQVCNLSKVDRYKVSRLLNANNDFLKELKMLHNKAHAKKPQDNILNWDNITYNSYCAITKVIDTILSTSEESYDAHETTSSLDEIKRLITSIQPLQCQIEVIENVYSCLFLRYEYFSCNDHSQGFPCGTHSDCSYFYSKKQTKTNNIKRAGVGFVCNSFTTQMILNTLKNCLEKLEESGTNSTDSNVTSRLKHLVKVVNYSVWKLQLVSNLSPDTSPLQLRLCLDFVEADESTDEEDREVDVKVVKKKTKVRRRHTNPKPDAEQAMLTSTVSVEDGFSLNIENSVDFISIMLAKPNCLVALALYHNDFAKANQIIEMFDLADAEIATEVTFTEQLRHLVGKIKNIIYYRDNTPYPNKELSALSVVSTEVMSLVEGFLSSNRAPNPYDIIELASRHPHLQLYSHQNAPFINSVDILLSSSLNREITYGLINVVERKLAEVRSSTDVASVKKTNYIRFVEDIASVIFEIFGNTEKSFDYVDNACELISDCRVPIKHKEFCKMNQLTKDLRQACEDLDGIINPNDIKEIDANLLQKYHQIFMNVVTASDKDLYNISEVARHFNKKTRVPYLRLCYKYCKTVSQLDQDDKKSTDSIADSQYFAVLEKQLHNIFGNMINDKETPVTYLEPICKKLNVNLIPKLILNFCPSIPLGVGKEATEMTYKNMFQAMYEFTNKEENLFLDPTTNLAPLPRMPDPQCITYIVLQNWVLAHIVKKIHVSTDESNLQHSMDARTKYLNNHMELERFNVTKMLFGGNKYLASLHTTIDLEQLFQYIPTLIDCGKIVTCLNIIEALSERQLISSENLNNFRDMVLFKLALNPKINNNWKYCQYLKSVQLKTTLILNNMSKWSAEGAMEAVNYLRFLLEREDTETDESIFDDCTTKMIKIPLYDQIATILGYNHWYYVHQRSTDDPECIIEGLMDNQQFKLCLEWADIHDMSDNIKNLIVKNLLKQMFEYTDQATPDLVRKLLSRLSVEQAKELIQEKMTKVRNVEILQVCVDFISENSMYWKTFENIKIGLMIMLELKPGMRNFFWDLIEMPLVMIEQFLMNSKLDLLGAIINKISPSLNRDSSGDNLYYNIKLIDSIVISRNSVDALLRYYAEKCLDMNNTRRPSSGSLRLTDDSLLLSIDSINIEAASKPFVMPAQVPTKEQWVEDYSTDRCMLCRTSIFSMIIRRHHCRRCGRLVCHVCSTNRMQVPSYPSEVKFRVCDDCYTQTMSKKANTNNDNIAMSCQSESGGSGVSCMDWCLSTNAERNEAVRAEFSYEFTPNVTLCLSIMRMHSINLDYPRFLLDRSDEVARELSNGGDARLLVRARRSLLLAAAELYSRTHHDNSGLSKVAEAGAAHAARCLAHAEALATLVKHQAHHLIAHHKDHPGQLVRTLLEAEKWELALEIATKSGLPRNSVLAAWGKACLKAGCFKRAREKFAHCFRNSMNVLVDVAEDYEVGKEASETVTSRRMHGFRHSDRASSTSSVQSDGRPRVNPPLLSEIIAMLEDMNYPVNQQLLQKAEALNSTNEKLTTMNAGKKKISVVEPALNIMHTLATVKKIKTGDYSDFQTGVVQPKKSLAHGLSLGLLRNNNNHNEPKPDVHKGLDPFFYKECVYYLSNYGSHVANISFYMKHSNIAEVLIYCQDNAVDKETFTESVYMECLRKDRVNELLKSMTDMDSTLESWADYITHICRTLEMSKRLEALYAVQCGSGQWARAAATCALQYARPAPRDAAFAALHRRHRYLAAALDHLSHAQPLANRTNDPKSLHFHLDKTTIDNLITTITRQMELCKYLAACEASGRLTEQMVEQVITIPGQQSLSPETKELRPLTLFGSTTDKIRLVAIVLAAGQTVEEGFELAFKIIKEHKLDSMNIYTHVARYLVQADRFMEVKTLAKCIRESKETAASLMSDQVLEAGACAVVARCEARGQLHDEQCEVLVADVRSVSVRVSCYLASRNVHDAYILAATHNRANDLRRVLHAAERLANEQVRSACLKRLAHASPR